MNELFTVCKIEAGRAILLSQKDFELIEFPSKLLPNTAIERGTVKISVASEGDSRATAAEAEIAKMRLIEEVEEEFGVDEELIEGIRETVGNCLRIENLGITAAILTWDQRICDTFGPKIRIENVILDLEAMDDALEDYTRDFVNFAIKGLKGISPEDTKCRVNLPIDLKAKLIVKSSVGYFWSNSVELKCRKIEDFSVIFVLTDLTGPEATMNRLQFIREQGGYISRQYSPEHPITAVVTDSIGSTLFKIGIDNNLPVVDATWLEALVATMELPRFEDHLVKRHG